MSHPLLRGCCVSGAGIVRINQLSASVADSNRCGDDHEAPDHSGSRHGVNESRPPKCQDKHRRHERETDSPHELFGVFLVPLECGVGDDTFDPLLFTFTRIHRDEAAREEHGLQRNDNDPRAARPNPTCP